MIKVVYIGEDDCMALLKHGDTFCSWAVSDDGSYYIVENNRGEEVYIQKDEVALY